ncbi:MAG TPA: alpha/beta hydrolase [Kofleriaceae bacterium]
MPFSVEVDQRSVIARDGTRLGYQVRGEGPAVVLANGLGGQYIAFKYLIEALGGYKMICWDYRGLYSSGAAKDPRANTIAHQVDDLMVILENEGVGDFAMAGWSMGVQVGFETIKRHRDRVKGMLAINGTYGKPFRTVMGSRIIGRVIPTLLKIIKAQSSLAGRATRIVTGSEAVFNAMKRFGMVADTVDMEIFRETAGAFQQLDWKIYSDLLARLDEHDAEDVLSTVDVPVTIITADGDLMTPPATSEHMHRLVRGSRLVMIEGGTHYTPVEFPKILVEELGRWLDRIPGWERKGKAA